MPKRDATRRRERGQKRASDGEGKIQSGGRGRVIKKFTERVVNGRSQKEYLPDNWTVTTAS